MARTARKLSSTGVYHIVIRGIDRQLFFIENTDYKKYLDLLAFYKNKCEFQLYAYCLMNNHVHLLIYTPTTALQQIFRRLGTAYAEWFNMKYCRVGTLQQGRYYSEPIESVAYLHNVVKYIHFNPTKAGLESFPGESYPWSSYNAYLQKSGFVDTQLILDSLGSKLNFKIMHSAPCCEEFLDIDKIRHRIPDDVAAEIINKECGCPNIVTFQKLPRLDQESNIRLLHKKGLSARQLNRLTGSSIGYINRIIAGGKK